ncbi:MAG: hypothetical protein ACI8QT_001799 [Halioglobus sp.]
MAALKLDIEVLLVALVTEHRTDYYDLFSVVRYTIILDTKCAAMEEAGMGRIESFSLPFVQQQFEKCEAG